MDVNQSIPPPPWINSPDKWVTLPEFARMWNKSQDTIYEWVHSGFIASIGVISYQDVGGRWWLRLPNA